MSQTISNIKITVTVPIWRLWVVFVIAKGAGLCMRIGVPIDDRRLSERLGEWAVKTAKVGIR
jgi:hypothetical protein